jgi:putative ABC transport system substrate-binding protein
VKRREFISLIGGAAVAWPLTARGQQSALPVIGFLDRRSPDALADRLRAFRQGLKDTGYVAGENVAIEYRWAENQVDRLPVLAAELARQPLAVIVASGGAAVALRVKAATTTIPIVFLAAEDPVRLGLVASLARPGGNATGINFLNQEVASKRLRLLHELVPNAVRVALLVNPANASGTETALRIVQEAAPTIGLQIQILKASTSREIDAAFSTLVRDRADALFVAPDSFFSGRRTLAAHHRVPAAYTQRDFVEAGGLMSYGTDIVDMYRQVGVYTGQILKGAKPADLPVEQPTKFELVINLKAAKALGLEIPPTLLARADEVIE